MIIWPQTILMLVCKFVICCRPLASKYNLLYKIQLQNSGCGTFCSREMHVVDIAFQLWVPVKVELALRWGMSSGGEAASSLRVYTWDEINQHNTAESLWVVIEGQVYDVTQFQEEVSVGYQPSINDTIKSVQNFRRISTVKSLKCDPSFYSDHDIVSLSCICACHVYLHTHSL